jgi:hypothetical protein
LLHELPITTPKTVRDGEKFKDSLGVVDGSFLLHEFIAVGV